MNEIESITFSTDIPFESNTDKVCRYFEEIGWMYDRKENKVQLSFMPEEGRRIKLIVCVADILSDKIYISAHFGINVDDTAEFNVLKFFNYVNAFRIYYGRFTLVNNSVWFDCTFDSSNGISKESILKMFRIADKTVNHFCDYIAAIASGQKTVEESIEEIEKRI